MGTDRTRVREVEARATVILTRVAVVIVLLTDALYVALIASQPDQSPDSRVTVPFIAGYMLVMAGLLAASLLSRPRILAVRTLLRAGPAGGLLLLGTLAAFSIGLPILVASALGIVGAARSLPRPAWRRPAAVGALAALTSVVVLVAGIDVSERVIICPASGVISGSGSGLVSGPYHYECQNGVLTFHPSS
jgi:hypothetical protein